MKTNQMELLRSLDNSAKAIGTVAELTYKRDKLKEFIKKGFFTAQ